MKKSLQMAIIISCVVYPGFRGALAQLAEDYLPAQWVAIQDGEISAAFYEMPVQTALSAFRAKTGFQIDIPNFAANRLVNLRIDRQRLEPAVRSVIFSIGFKNFALMYDDTGRPNRAVVLNAHLEESRDHGAEALTSKTSALLALTPEEREEVQKELDRWKDLSKEEQGRIEDRLKTIPASEDRDRLVAEYGRRILGIEN